MPRVPNVSIQPPARVLMKQLGARSDGGSGGKAYKMKKSYAAHDLGRFFVTGPTDASGKLRHFFCTICRKVGLVRTHGPYKILQFFSDGSSFHSRVTFEAGYSLLACPGL